MSSEFLRVTNQEDAHKQYQAEGQRMMCTTRPEHRTAGYPLGLLLSGFDGEAVACSLFYNVKDPVRTAHRVSRPILTWNVCPSHKEAPASTHIKDFPGERAHPKYAVSEK